MIPHKMFNKILCHLIDKFFLISRDLVLIISDGGAAAAIIKLFGKRLTSGIECDKILR